MQQLSRFRYGHTNGHLKSDTGVATCRVLTSVASSPCFCCT